MYAQHSLPLPIIFKVSDNSVAMPFRYVTIAGINHQVLIYTSDFEKQFTCITCQLWLAFAQPPCHRLGVSPVTSNPAKMGFSKNFFGFSSPINRLREGILAPFFSIRVDWGSSHAEVCICTPSSLDVRVRHQGFRHEAREVVMLETFSPPFSLAVVP